MYCDYCMHSWWVWSEVKAMDTEISSLWTYKSTESLLFRKICEGQIMLDFISIYNWKQFEMPRDKTNKVACAPSVDSDQANQSSLCA